jgi:hypothetical protein
VLPTQIDRTFISAEGRCPQPSVLVAASRVLDLDDVGTECTEQGTGRWDKDELGGFDDTHAVEDRVHGGILIY